jgi:hypothetical protein
MDGLTRNAQTQYNFAVWQLNLAAQAFGSIATIFS